MKTKENGAEVQKEEQLVGMIDRNDLEFNKVPEPTKY